MKKKEVISKLKEYFNDIYLEILDNDIPARGMGNKYVAVTFEYILKYVLENKCTPKLLINCLVVMIKERRLSVAVCEHLNRVVFAYSDPSIFFSESELDLFLNNQGIFPKEMHEFNELYSSIESLADCQYFNTLLSNA